MPDGSVTDNQSSPGMPFGTQPFGPMLEQPNVAQKPVVQSSAGASTSMGALNQSSIEEAEKTGQPLPGSSANVDPQNPMPTAPDAVLSEPTAAPTKGIINQFLCCIFGVAMATMMQEIVKLDTERMLMSTEQQLDMQAILKDVADLTAAHQLSAGKTEMMMCFAKAICCGVQVAISAGVAVGSMYKGPRTATGAAIAQTGQALGGIGGQDSVASNLAQGIGAYEKAKHEAAITLLGFLKQFIELISQDMSSDKKDAQDQLGSLLQSFQQWMNNYYQMAARG